MFFESRLFRGHTVVAVLASFGWMSIGGPVWAEARSADRAPEQFLARMADDPRLAAFPELRERVREVLAERPGLAAVERVAAAEPSPGEENEGQGGLSAPAALGLGSLELGWSGTRGHAERRAAAQIGAVAERLGLGLGSDAGLGGDAGLGRAHVLGGSVSPGAGNGRDLGAEALRAALSDTRHRLLSAHQGALAGFGQTGSRLHEAGLPATVLARHEAATESYRQSMEAVLTELDLAAASDDAEIHRDALLFAAEALAGTGDTGPSRALDPSRLPFDRAESVERRPGAFYGDLLAPNRARSQKAQAPPGAADLAATEDAPATPEIVAKAAELGNEPLAIYDFVRNEIDFVPTFGSVQGAHATLVAERGNAFDIASLLLALLRAADVPARYVLGTVEAPVAEVQNWVGGAATGRVAQQVLGQGGVPNVGLLAGGELSAIRFDHVWVEAWIDHVPSRGAVQIEGDTWLPLDAAFKQFEFTERSSIFEARPIDQAFDGSDLPFEVDEDLGLITNVDYDAFDTTLIEWMEGNDEYLLSTGETRDFDTLLGGKTVIEETSTVFAGSLPYRILERSEPVAELADDLRHSVRLRGFSSSSARAFGNPSFDVEVSLPTLEARRLDIRFEPATQTDADVLANARDSGASSLPVYLVDVRPVVALDGVALGTGSAVQMGGNYFVDVVLDGPGGATTVPYQVVAGDEIVVGVTGNGVSPAAIEKRFAENPVESSVEYFHQVQLHYWMESDLFSEVAARSMDVHQLRLPSVGFFSSPLTVSYFFGAPRTGVYQGRVMDVQRSLVGAAAEDPEQVVAFVKQSGHHGSYLEGSIFDQLEETPSPLIKGISSIHLISAAAAQGIPIYRITNDNLATVLPRLQLSSAVRQDIQSGVGQGKTVLTPERELTFGAWRGVGYIVQDEVTGGGAYLISGGRAGGGLWQCVEELVPVLVKVLVIAFLIILALYLAWLLAGLLAGVLAGLLGGGLAGAGAAAAVFLFFLLVNAGTAPTSTQTA